MQTLSLYDSIYIKKIDKPVIRVKSNLDWLPTDERNLAYKGAQLLKNKFNIQQGIFIQLDKKIPVAAGLAGGSADCAAVMVGINKLFGIGLSKKKLMEIALQLGADIPYCILQGTALAEGIGEKLTPIKTGCPFCYVLLAKPNINISTASVYQNLELDKIIQHPNTEQMLFQAEKPKMTISHDLLSLQEQLKNRLQTKVKIKQSETKGKIEIEFYGDDDLKRVIDALGGEFY